MKLGRILIGVFTLFFIAYAGVYIILDHAAQTKLKQDQQALIACHQFYKQHPSAVPPLGLEMPEGAILGPLCLHPNKISHDFLGFPVYKRATAHIGTFG